jgi:hypothetical protein
MRRAVMLCAMMMATACGAPSVGPSGPRARTGAEQGGSLEDLAREIDPGPQRAIWPQAPADARAKVEIDAPRDRAPAARLAAARERIAQWSVQASSGELDVLVAKFDRAFEGVYLAEPLALSAEIDPTSLEARALLWRFYRVFKVSVALLQSIATSWGGAEPKVAKTLAVARILEDAAPKMADRLAADILRAGAPEEAVADILWAQASERIARGDTAGGRALSAELIRRTRSSTSLDNQLRIAEAYIRVDDVRGAADAIARARSSVAASDRTAQARIRVTDRDREALTRLLALPADKSPATSLARFDLLMDLNRRKEAEALLAGLAVERPKDARVRARTVRVRVSNGDVSDSLVEHLRGEDLTDRTSEYWSTRIGAAGLAAAKGPSRSILDEIVDASMELAKDQPGRAAALAFIVERVKRLIEKPPDAATIIASLGPMLDDALALRAKYPAEPDVDRIAIALSLFAEPAKGLKIALVRPKANPADEPDLYGQRARTIVTLAAYLGKSADLAAVRTSVEEIPPSTIADVEGGREALLGDVEILAAVHGERAAWARAVTHYESAKKITKTDRARLDNNLGYAAAVLGDEARAHALFDAASHEKSGRRWVPLLNLATASGTNKESQLAAVRAIAGPADAEPPTLVNVWRASLEPGTPEATLAATKALADFDTPFARQRFALNALGIETEGTFAVNLSLRSGHTLSAVAHATLWLVRPMPLSPAELEAKTKAGPPKPPAKK